MKVVLLADVKGTGKKGEACNVSDGYARNFLLPKKLAVVADTAAMNDLKHKASAREHHLQEEIDAAKKMAASIQGKTIHLTAKAGKEGRLFGSVTGKEVAEVLKREYGISLDKRKVELECPVKAFGSYKVRVKFAHSITAEMTLSVTEAQ